jgi:UDP-N-acetylglucosamine 2-epimerase (non-hydrolysing)
MPDRALIIFGTRPEAIKLVPVIQELRSCSVIEPVVAVTAQHREMLDQVLELFDVVPDHDLDLMQPRQSLTDLASRSLAGLGALVEEVKPAVAIVQGDTTTTLAGALTAFYHRVPVAHVEAGLRTDDLNHPFPEEANRRLTTRVTRWHFAPTTTSETALIAEGVQPQDIHVTGNTVIDALLQVAEEPYEWTEPAVRAALESGRRIVLVTAHRRENWGQPMERICAAIRALVEHFDDVHVLFATHRNPAVLDTVESGLDGVQRVELLGPQPYLGFVKLMQASTIILSDSGGVQEEAPSFGKPVLVLREKTERTEAVEAGVVTLVGTDTERIVADATTLLTDVDAYDAMARVANPFGDGTASRRIVDVLEREL